MRVDIGDIRLFVDVEGAGLVPDGPKMRQKPTLVLLHGGPGADHSIYKPQYSQLSDLCQILYVDHRGNGRSDDSTPAHWNLAQWADDLAALLDRLGIEQAVIYGASFGGFVAQSFAARHPERISALILSSTSAHVDFDEIYAAFARIAGQKEHDIAKAYWSAPSPERRQAYAKDCLPWYTRQPIDSDFWARVELKNPVAMHFNGPDNEMGRFDFRKALSGFEKPVLVISGGLDPIMPVAFSEQIVAALPQRLCSYHCLEDAAHMASHDQPDAYFSLLRDFLMRIEE